MNNPELKTFTEQFTQEMRDLLEAKGSDYSRSNDRLSNFKRIANLLDLPPLVIWNVYAQKHKDAIDTFCRTGTVSSEAIRGRFLDLANYCLLGAALVDEQQKGQTNG